MTKSPERRLEVLRLLRDAKEPMEISQIAERLGVHANTVRFHLQTLVDHGQVERAVANSAAPGRPPHQFQATQGMDPMGPRHYRVLAEVFTASLATDPAPRSRAVEAGHAWGRQQAAASTNVETGAIDADGTKRRLVKLLDDLDFAPEVLAGQEPSSIGLRHCPFLELAESRATIVCSIHLGLMRGAMESWGSTLTVERLDAFVEPALCVAHLESKGTP